MRKLYLLGDFMNKVILMGRLTKEPELRYTSGSNTAVCSFTLAVNKRFQKQGEERKADFINCQAWEKTAEFIAKYFQKGSQIAVVGRIQTRTWDDTEGKKHYVTEVVVEETFFADSKKGEGAPQKTQNSDNNDGFYPIEDDDELPF
jgi:single-strand DNA-binding protein